MQNLTTTTTGTLVQVIISNLSYCSSLLIGLFDSVIVPLASLPNICGVWDKNINGCAYLPKFVKIINQ